MGISPASAPGGNRLELPEVIRQLVDELPPEFLPAVAGAVQARCWRELLADRSHTFPPAPAVEQTEPLTTKQAGVALGCSSWEVLARVRRGVLSGVQDMPNGRWHFEPAEIARYKRDHSRGGVAAGIVQRYTPPHAETPGRTPEHPHHVESGRGARAPVRPRLDAAPACHRARRDGDDGRPLGARRPGRNAPRRDQPYAPGAAAWSGPVPPAPRDPPPEG